MWDFEAERKRESSTHFPSPPWNDNDTCCVILPNRRPKHLPPGEQHCERMSTRRRVPPLSPLAWTSLLLSTATTTALTDGWEAFLLNASTSCTIPRVASLSVADFRASYKGRKPVLYGRPREETEVFRRLTRLEELLREGGEDDSVGRPTSSSSSSSSYGSLPVILAASNSYSHAKRTTTLAEYLRTELDPPASPWARRADETWYFFGDTLGEEWTALLDTYPFPLDTSGDEGLRVFGVGGAYSGVAFHTHGAAHAECVRGRKRWYLAPPEQRPVFDGDASQLQWALEHGDGGGVEVGEGEVADDGPGSDAARGGRGILACTAGEGEVIYVPPGWWHATLNLDPYNVFVSTFTQEWRGGAGGGAGSGAEGEEEL
jgi:hypothetical protein